MENKLSESSSRPTSMRESQRLQKIDLKKSHYIDICSRFPAFRNPKVMETLTLLDSLNLTKKGKGRKFIKHNKVNVDNTVYIGEVSKTYKRDGSGFLAHDDGSFYEGYFVEGHYQGFGRLITADGDIYEGEWETSILQGEGKICIKHPFSLYTGTIKNGLPEGYGTLVSADKSEYQGEFKDGKKYGNGILKFNDGSRYEGEFIQDKQSGSGVFYFKDNSVLTGRWARNKLVGEATKKWPDGRVYIGELTEGNIDGKGKMTWPDGRIYEGYWNNGRSHGIGKETRPNGVIIEGHWRSGKVQEITNEVSAPHGHLFKDEISSSVKELEEKVNEARKRRGETFDELKFKYLLNMYHAIDHCHTIENTLEKEKRMKGRVEEKILKDVQRRVEKQKFPRALDKKEDCFNVSKLLNAVKLRENMNEYMKIWEKRKEQIKFDYYDPDVLVPEDIEMQENWIEIGDKEMYIGETNKKGMMNGRGIYLKKREVYEGYFLNNKKHGIGREITMHSIYIGYWADGKKSGFGTKTKGSSFYVGDFKNDVYSGTGYLKTSEATYNGTWKLGKQHGKGQLKFSDGRIYKGDFENGIIRGYGSFIWTTGKSVIGYWENGAIVGESEKAMLSKDEMTSILDDNYEEEQAKMDHSIDKSSEALLEDLKNMTEPNQ